MCDRRFYRSLILVSALASCLCVVFAPRCSRAEPVQEYLLQPLTVTGTVHIMEVLEASQGAVHDAVEAFKPINDTCGHLIQQKMLECANCVRTRCEQRIEYLAGHCQSGVNLATQLMVLAIDFVTDIGKLVIDKLPNLIIDSVGGHLIDAGKEIAQIFTGTFTDGLQQLGKELGNLGGNLGNVVLDIGGVLENVGKELLSGIGDVGKLIIGGTIDLGQTIGKEFGNLLGNVGDLGGNIFKGIGKIFGRRRRRGARGIQRYLRQLYLARGEPGCDDFGSDEQAKQACLYYASVCATCDIDKDRDCPGYEAAWDRIIEATNDAKWMNAIDDLKYGVTSANYNPLDFDPQLVGYRNVQVEVNVFGLAHSLTIPEPVNIFDAQKAGPVIARYAVEWFQQQHSLRLRR